MSEKRVGQNQIWIRRTLLMLVLFVVVGFHTAVTQACGGDLSHPLEIISSKPVLSIGFAYTDNEKQSHFCGID